MGAARQRITPEPFPPQPSKGIFFNMKTKKFTKKELSDAVVLLMQLYEIQLEEAIFDIDNDGDSLKNRLKKLIMFNMNVGKEAYLETAMRFVKNEMESLQYV